MSLSRALGLTKSSVTMKLSSIIITTIACLLLAAVGFTRAQDEGGRKHLLHELGGPFFVSRDKVQEELQLSNAQRQKLQEKLSSDIQEAKTADTSAKLKTLKGSEREKLMQPFYERLEAFLKEIMTADQHKRFEQLKLQYDTPSIMLRPEIVTKLNITDEQRQKFMVAIQDMQKEIAPLLKESKSGGNLQDILLKVTRLRQACQGKIVALLNDAQKQQWEEMTGTPFVIW